jgi:SAM-dependent methyltransferase
MSTNSNFVADYGWHDVASLPSHSYLAPPIVRNLRRLQAKKVLDLGCGNGAFSHYLQAQGFEVVGCDVDPRGIELAASGQSGARFKNVGVYDPPESLGESGFDAVVSTEVVEHLFRPTALPQFAAALLREGGHLLVSTPFHGYLKNLLIALTGKWDTHHGPMHEGGHIKFWSYRTLSLLLEENGFRVTGFMGAGRCWGLWKSMILTAEKVRAG